MLTHVGELLSVPNEAVADGANVTIVVPLAQDEYFVRTYERGAGPTASCGSGMTAARAVLTRTHITSGLDANLLRNVGGPAFVSLGQDNKGEWFGLLDGNATESYRVEVDTAKSLDSQNLDVRSNESDQQAFEAVYQTNKAAIEAAGIDCDFTPADIGRA